MRRPPDNNGRGQGDRVALSNWGKIMQKLLLAAAAALTLPFGAVPALADGHEMAQPEMLEQDWHRVTMVKFHPGKRERASEIIEMFNKTSQTMGEALPLQIHMNTGAWDMIVAFPMKHGIAQMGWRDTPENKAWQAEFAKMVGGKDKAQAIFKEFDSLVADRQQHIGHTH